MARNDTQKPDFTRFALTIRSKTSARRIEVFIETADPSDLLAIGAQVTKTFRDLDVEAEIQIENM